MATYNWDVGTIERPTAQPKKFEVGCVPDDGFARIPVDNIAELHPLSPITVSSIAERCAIHATVRGKSQRRKTVSSSHPKACAKCNPGRKDLAT
jgi:hypothetical protein